MGDEAGGYIKILFRITATLKREPLIRGPEFFEKNSTIGRSV